jgi:hypothetical protein
MVRRQVQQFEGKTCTPVASIAESQQAAVTVNRTLEQNMQ